MENLGTRGEWEESTSRRTDGLSGLPDLGALLRSHRGGRRDDADVDGCLPKQMNIQGDSDAVHRLQADISDALDAGEVWSA